MNIYTGSNNGVGKSVSFLMARIETSMNKLKKREIPNSNYQEVLTQQQHEVNTNDIVINQNKPYPNNADINILDMNKPDTNNSDMNIPDANMPDKNISDINIPNTNKSDINKPDINIQDDYIDTHIYKSTNKESTYKNENLSKNLINNVKTDDFYGFEWKFIIKGMMIVLIFVSTNS
jgi:hypothetical protein